MIIKIYYMILNAYLKTSRIAMWKSSKVLIFFFSNSLWSDPTKRFNTCADGNPMMQNIKLRNVMVSYGIINFQPKKKIENINSPKRQL